MKKGILLTLVLLYFPLQSFSQFYKIYGYLTPDANEKELVYWFTAIPSMATHVKEPSMHSAAWGLKNG